MWVSDGGSRIRSGCQKKKVKRFINHWSTKVNDASSLLLFH